eukprot:838464_1
MYNVCIQMFYSIVWSLRLNLPYCFIYKYFIQHVLFTVCTCIINHPTHINSIHRTVIMLQKQLIVFTLNSTYGCVVFSTYNAEYVSLYKNQLHIIHNEFTTRTYGGTYRNQVHTHTITRH